MNKKSLFSLIIVFLFSFSIVFSAAAANLTAHFIDVGQGDSILIQTPSKNILIDAGERFAGSIVVDYLQSQGVKELDLVISTHPHSDHIGGLIDVLKAFRVKEVIDPAIIHTTKTFEEYLSLIDQKNIIFTQGRAGLRRDLGHGISMTILHPTKPRSNNLNDTSVVARVEYEKVSFLFTGDAETASEGELLERAKQLRSTVLKVGHHGSRTSTSPAFLSAVNPTIAVIMLGAENKYGHPHPETLNRLMTAGVDVYRTDRHGTITISTDGKSIKIQTEKNTPSGPWKTNERTFVGSKNANTYHYPTCRYAQTIKSENLIFFAAVAEAKKGGYKPCGVCKPPSQ